MTRRETNNPSARIGRLLDEYDQLEAAYDQLAVRFLGLLELPQPTGAAIMAAWTASGVKPVGVAVAEERVRRQFTLGKNAQAASRMRRLRSKDRHTINTLLDEPDG